MVGADNLKWSIILSVAILTGVVLGGIALPMLTAEKGKVNLYGRRSTSGTYVYFREHVVENWYSDEMYNMAGNKNIVYAVKHDVNGVGYVGAGYVTTENREPIEGIKILKIAKDENSEAVSPLNPLNVKTGKYPIARPLYQYTRGKPGGGSLLYEFLKFELSEEGEEIVKDTGFYPLMPSDRKHNENKFEEFEGSEGGSLKGELSIKGSDTELELVSNFAKSFTENRPKAKIIVEGGGSGTGINALIQGRTDVADSSRKIKQEEIRTAESNGINPVEFIIARDAICIIVNPSNPVDNLTVEELSKMFGGEITSWEDVRGG